LDAVHRCAARDVSTSRCVSLSAKYDDRVLLASSGLFLGNDLLAYLVLALGGALLVGNGMALVRPPDHPDEGDLRRAPVGRTLVMMSLGAVAALWALGSLLSR
jgi:hypothetical protein